MSEVDRVDRLEQALAAVTQGLAVHQAECTGSYKAMQVSIEQLSAKLDLHVADSMAFRREYMKQTQTTLKIFGLSVLMLAAIIFLGPAEVIKILISLVK